MKQENKNEFVLLLNEGCDDEQEVTLGEYFKSHDEADDETIELLYPICKLAVGETLESYRSLDSVKRIN